MTGSKDSGKMEKAVFPVWGVPGPQKSYLSSPRKNQCLFNKSASTSAVCQDERFTNLDRDFREASEKVM